MNTDDKHSIFTRAMQDVNPLTSDKTSLKHPREAIQKRQSVSEPHIKDTLSDDFIPDCEDYLEFMRPGIQKSYMKQIRNGKIDAQGHLDLHGFHREDARKALLDFLEHSQQASHKLVRIVHGKGHHSGDGQAVLKAMVNKWLQNIPQVLAFVSTPPNDGGTGAVYVLLKKHREQG